LIMCFLLIFTVPILIKKLIKDLMKHKSTTSTPEFVTILAPDW
jgi:hypothetical protein